MAQYGSGSATPVKPVVIFLFDAARLREMRIDAKLEWTKMCISTWFASHCHGTESDEIFSWVLLAYVCIAHPI